RVMSAILPPARQDSRGFVRRSKVDVICSDYPIDRSRNTLRTMSIAYKYDLLFYVVCLQAFLRVNL
ncbi:hypothetical protein, partial [Xanthomonas fragariae]